MSNQQRMPPSCSALKRWTDTSSGKHGEIKKECVSNLFNALFSQIRHCVNEWGSEWENIHSVTFTLSLYGTKLSTIFKIRILNSVGIILDTMKQPSTFDWKQMTIIINMTSFLTQMGASILHCDMQKMTHIFLENTWIDSNSLNVTNNAPHR